MEFLGNLLLFLGRPKSMSATLCRRRRFRRGLGLSDAAWRVATDKQSPWLQWLAARSEQTCCRALPWEENRAGRFVEEGTGR